MSEGPLSHIRVLELGGYIAGPYGTSLLQSLGAEVVKVERPGSGDDFRRNADDKSPYFRQYNAGKRSLAVDLKHPEGAALIRDLLPHFDVLVENLRPGKLADLDLSAAQCSEVNPDLIYLSVTGFGSDGPLASRPAYDSIGQSYGGLYSLLGDAGDAQLSGTILADLITGVSAAVSVLAALVGRNARGGGTRVETSIMESVTLLTADALAQLAERRSDPSRQSRHPQAQNFCVETSDGEHVTIHLSSSQKFWEALVAALRRPDLLADERFNPYRARETNYFELVPVVAEEFARHPLAEWETRLTENDVPYAPVLTMSTYMAHPQVAHLEMFEPERDGMSVVRPPWRFDGQRPGRAEPTPRVGRDTVALAAEVRDAKRIRSLMEQGVLYEPRP